MKLNGRLLIGVALVAVLALGIWIGRRAPVEQAAGPQPAVQTAAAPETQAPAAADPYQRSISTFEFKKAAVSGVERGREIFYYKCWFCHNDLAEGAPKLEGVFERPALMSGRPANEDGIKEEIREGGAGMAAYKYTLSETDLNDLVSYLREDCCWNSDAPPPNPNYRAGVED